MDTLSILFYGAVFVIMGAGVGGNLWGRFRLESPLL
jgi:hypothetical protein